MITLKGRITDAAPGAKFKVTLDTGHVINAVISGKIRKNNIQILLGDLVETELSPYDMTLGRIVFRYDSRKEYRSTAEATA
jgi:translation initiation factor IF-1